MRDRNKSIVFNIVQLLGWKYLETLKYEKILPFEFFSTTMYSNVQIFFKDFFENYQNKLL